MTKDNSVKLFEEKQVRSFVVKNATFAKPEIDSLFYAILIYSCFN